MPRIHRSEVKVWGQKFRPRTPPSAPPEHNSHTDVADTHQNDTDEAEAPHNKPDSAPADTPDNPADTVSGPLFGMDQCVTLILPQHQL